MKARAKVLLGWACVALTALLVSVALGVLLIAWRLEADVRSMRSDSVPGLTESNQLRSALSEGFVCALQFAVASAAERPAWLARLDAADQSAQSAAMAYRRTIHIDPVGDRTKLDAVLTARDAFFGQRARWLELARKEEAAAQQTAPPRELTRSYATLMERCDQLIAFNSGTGTAIATRLTRQAVTMRTAAIAVLGLGLIALAFIAAILANRLRLEREHRQTERKLSLAFRVSPHSMVISRRSDGRIIAANDAFRRYYGLMDRDVVGKTALELGVWSSPEERAAMIQLLETRGRVTNYLRRPGPVGLNRVLLLSAEPLELDGEPCLLAVGQDVTEQVHAEEALARYAAELRTIFDHAALGITLVNTDGRIIRCNPAFERLLQYSNEELLRLSFAELTHPDDRTRDVQQFQLTMSGASEAYHLAKRYVRKDGATVWANLTASLVRDVAGQGLYIIGMIEDVTDQVRAAAALRRSESERQQLQQQLIQAQKLDALGQLAGGVAHDFNNMLAAIMLYLDVLRMDRGMTPAMLDSVDEVAKTARRAAGLTRQLLLFSRREPAQRHIVDLSRVVSDLLKMLDRLLGANYSVVHHRGADPVWVLGDSGMLEQVVMNLVVNARDAMPKGGRIEVTTDACEIVASAAGLAPAARPGRYARLTVTDHGCGMNAATRQRIFEPFFTTKPAGKGTGLGLATVFGIVEQHAGWVSVDSEEARGSAFTVHLPLHGDRAPEGPLATCAPASQATRHETILLAEDDASVRNIAARILRNAGYEVLEAPDAIAAKEILRERGDSIDLLVSDVVMPGMTGDELAAGLPRGHNMKVVLMSAHQSRIGEDELAALGAVYLAKPFDTERLLQAVRAVLDAPPNAARPRRS